MAFSGILTRHFLADDSTGRPPHWLLKNRVSHWLRPNKLIAAPLSSARTTCGIYKQVRLGECLFRHRPSATGRRHSLPQTRRQIGGCPLSSAAVSDQASTTLCTFARKTPFASADKATDQGMSTLFRCS
ncbi:uncharacterized protein [Littorina saxatilis]|uniref:Uncharacterized protein n=1 Tax=Littorina saxatilis TaxID=31220 RepID=A0AAN9BI76_9CAEN